MVQRLVAGSAMRAATLIFVGVIGGGLVLRNLEATTGAQNCGASGCNWLGLFFSDETSAPFPADKQYLESFDV